MRTDCNGSETAHGVLGKVTKVHFHLSVICSESGSVLCLRDRLSAPLCAPIRRGWFGSRVLRKPTITYGDGSFGAVLYER